MGWRDTGAQASRSHAADLAGRGVRENRSDQTRVGRHGGSNGLYRGSDERFWEAEHHRVKGDLLLLHGTGAHEVETCYCQSIEVARHQAAKSLELRATMRLCRLWQQQGKSADAYQRLAAIIGWFTEGFYTADLIAARALLATLK